MGTHNVTLLFDETNEFPPLHASPLGSALK
jgi:hypothetical protein